MDYKTLRLFFFSPMESSSTFKNSLWREFWSTLRSKSSKDFLQLWFYLKCSYLFELASDQSLKLGKSPLCTVRWRRAVLRAQKERWYRTTGICWLLLLHWGGLCSSIPYSLCCAWCLYIPHVAVTCWPGGSLSFGTEDSTPWNSWRVSNGAKIPWLFVTPVQDAGGNYLVPPRHSQALLGQVQRGSSSSQLQLTPLMADTEAGQMSCPWRGIWEQMSSFLALGEVIAAPAPGLTSDPYSCYGYHPLQHLFLLQMPPPLPPPSPLFGRSCSGVLGFKQPAVPWTHLCKTNIYNSSVCPAPAVHPMLPCSNHLSAQHYIKEEEKKTSLLIHR